MGLPCAIPSERIKVRFREAQHAFVISTNNGDEHGMFVKCGS
jgi:hypothetical protein